MSPRLAGLDGLRGLAALCVLAFHAWLYRDGTPARVAKGDPADVALSSLRTALVLFFVLSGFLLARDLRRWLEDGVRPTLRDYATRRAMRILPAYWVAIVGSVALLWGGRPADGIRLPPADDLWVFAILGQNYFSDTVMKLNPVTWTLCVEVAFYALLPLLAVGLRALGRRGLPLAALLLVAGSLAANAAAHEHAWNLAERKSPLPYLGYFGIGIGVAWVAGRRRAALGSWPTAGLALGGVAAATGWVWCAPRPTP
jgi:peptidoglycan/LPS O-acetylase OafA/YrhL